MSIEERIEFIIQRVKDGVAEKDLRAYLTLVLNEAYCQGCEDTEKELEE